MKHRRLAIKPKEFVTKCHLSGVLSLVTYVELLDKYILFIPNRLFPSLLFLYFYTLLDRHADASSPLLYGILITVLCYEWDFTSDSVSSRKSTKTQN